jgi:predicted DNA-binding helix-hairpin-helix protein
MRAEKITLTIDEAGYLGVAGMAPVKTAEDIDTVIREIRFKLEEGVESIRRMAEKRKKIEGGE